MYYESIMTIRIIIRAMYYIHARSEYYFNMYRVTIDDFILKSMIFSYEDAWYIMSISNKNSLDDFRGFEKVPMYDELVRSEVWKPEKRFKALISYF